MAKYIIEFNDEPNKDLDENAYYSCKQVPWWSVSEGTIKRLTPYTEPDRKAIEDEVWELVKVIGEMEYDDYEKCFSSYGHEAFFNRPYQEVKSKYDAWKKDVRVGDEVEDDDGTRGIVFDINGTDLLGVCWEEERVSHFFWPKPYCRKTGRHFSEAERLLEALKVK